jgi:hypothetical protein
MTAPTDPNLTPAEIEILVSILNLATSLVEGVTELVPFAPYVLGGISIAAEAVGLGLERFNDICDG